MENETAAAAQTMLDQVNDAQSAGLVAAAEDPLWLWPVVGVCAAAFIASFEVQSTVVTIAATLFYCIGIGAVVGYVIRRRGVQPKLSSWTPALQKVFVYYLVGATVVAGVVVGCGFATNFYVAAGVAFFAVSFGGIWYHTRWRNVVAQTVAS